MKKMNEMEARKINGGAWRCKSCGRRYFLWCQLMSWASHSCVNFKYKWCL